MLTVLYSCNNYDKLVVEYTIGYLLNCISGRSDEVVDVGGISEVGADLWIVVDKLCRYCIFDISILANSVTSIFGG